MKKEKRRKSPEEIAMIMYELALRIWLPLTILWAITGIITIILNYT